MKKYIALFSFLFVSFHINPSFANEADSRCRNMGEIAKSIMERRQNGEPISNLIDIANKSSPDADVVKFMKKIVIEAYDMPLFTAEPFKERTINEFSNKYEVECLKSTLQ